MESKEQKLLRLAADHAYWSEKVRLHKKAGSDELTECVINTYELKFDDSAKPYEHCIDKAHQEFRILHDSTAWPDGYSFDEVWSEMVAEGKICKHCQLCREHRKKRVEASIRLGQVRSAITRIGKNLTPSVKAE